MAKPPGSRKKKWPEDLKALPPVAWMLTPYDLADASAMRSLMTGEATPEQQRRAVLWIIEECCDYYGMSFHPDHPRWQDFAEGKRSVARQIIGMAKADFSKMTKDQAPTEQPP